MALQNDCPDRTDEICKEAYWVLSLILSNITKTGIVELTIWRNQSARQKGKAKIASLTIPVSNFESLDSDGCVTGFAYSDFAWKSGKDCYGKIKTIKVRVDGEVINLTKATNV